MGIDATVPFGYEQDTVVRVHSSKPRGGKRRTLVLVIP